MRVAPLLLLVLPAALPAEVPATDRTCGAGEQCLPQADCPAFLEAKAELKQHPRGSSAYKAALTSLKGSICNKQKAGVCCAPPCTAVKITACPALADVYADYRGSDRTKKRAALAKIKPLVCNPSQQLVWCGACPGGSCTH
jgi:hypothetical protein